MFFNRSDLSAARNDFHQLEEIARRTAPPCRAYVHLADRGVHEGVSRYVTAVIYPAEYEDEMSRWLLEAAFAGGDTAEGGPSHVSNYYQEPNEIIARVQLHAAGAIPARSPDEVLGSVRQAVQR
jgi:hypothetical protein